MNRRQFLLFTTNMYCTLLDKVFFKELDEFKKMTSDDVFPANEYQGSISALDIMAEKKQPETNEKEKEKSKGITLIALVITIIVMLILVVVTIRISTKGGLFDYAGKAARETKDAIADEKDIADGKTFQSGSCR